MLSAIGTGDTRVSSWIGTEPVGTESSPFDAPSEDIGKAGVGLPADLSSMIRVAGLADAVADISYAGTLRDLRGKELEQAIRDVLTSAANSAPQDGEADAIQREAAKLARFAMDRKDTAMQNALARVVAQLLQQVPAIAADKRVQTAAPVAQPVRTEAELAAQVRQDFKDLLARKGDPTENLVGRVAVDLSLRYEDDHDYLAQLRRLVPELRQEHTVEEVDRLMRQPQPDMAQALEILNVNMHFAGEQERVQLYQAAGASIFTEQRFRDIFVALAPAAGNAFRGFEPATLAAAEKLSRWLAQNLAHAPEEVAATAWTALNRLVGSSQAALIQQAVAHGSDGNANLFTLAMPFVAALVERYPIESARGHEQGRVVAEAMLSDLSEETKRAVLDAALDRWINLQAPATNYVALEALADAVQNSAQAGLLVAGVLVERIEGILSLRDDEPRLGDLAPLSALAVQAVAAAGSNEGRVALLGALDRAGVIRLLNALGLDLSPRADATGWANGAPPDPTVRLMHLNQMLDAVSQAESKLINPRFAWGALRRIPASAYAPRFVDLAGTMARTVMRSLVAYDPAAQRQLATRLEEALKSPGGRALLTRLQSEDNGALKLDKNWTEQEMLIAVAYKALEGFLNDEQLQIVFDIIANMKLELDDRVDAMTAVVRGKKFEYAKAIPQMTVEERNTWVRCNLKQRESPLDRPFPSPPFINQHLPEVAQWVEREKSENCLMVRHEPSNGGIGGTHWKGRITIKSPMDIASLGAARHEELGAVYLHEFGHNQHPESCVTEAAKVTKTEFVDQRLLCEADAILFATGWLFKAEKSMGKTVRELEHHFSDKQNASLRDIARRLEAGQLSRAEAKQLVADMIKDTNAGNWVTYYQERYTATVGTK